MSEPNAVGVDWRAWVAALRSGDYVQGTGYLRRNNTWCCWGVACNVVDPTLWKGDPKGVMSYDGLDGFPSRRVCDSLGVAGKLNELKYTSMNDSGKTFSEIADSIEKEMTDGTI